MRITEHPTGAFTPGVHGTIRVVRETEARGVTVVTGEDTLDGEVSAYWVTAYRPDGSHGSVHTFPVLSWEGAAVAQNRASESHNQYARIGGE
jgi:hypothetical protein